MSRQSWTITLAALAVGLGLGLYVGWVAAPVQYTNTELPSLRSDYKDDSILMIAAIYAGDGDLAAARGQLAAFGLTDPAAAVRAAAGRLAAAGLPDADRQRLDGLQAALDSTAAPTALTPAALPSAAAP